MFCSRSVIARISKIQFILVLQVVVIKKTRIYICYLVYSSFNSKSYRQQCKNTLFRYRSYLYPNQSRFPITTRFFRVAQRVQRVWLHKIGYMNNNLWIITRFDCPKGKWNPHSVLDTRFMIISLLPKQNFPESFIYPWRSFPINKLLL
jgi:hypothetical protein